MPSNIAGADLLAVIDLQEAFRAGPWAAAGLEGIVGPVDQLAARFGPRTRFTRFVPPPDPTGSWIPYYERWPFALEPEAAGGWELVEPFRSRAPRTVDRPTFSKWGPELAEDLGMGGALVLCGAATDCCVLATALGAVDAGAAVRVVADACAGSTPEAHDHALALLEAFAPQVEITSLAYELDTPPRG